MLASRFELSGDEIQRTGSSKSIGAGATGTPKATAIALARPSSTRTGPRAASANTARSKPGSPAALDNTAYLKRVARRMCYVPKHCVQRLPPSSRDSEPAFRRF